MTFKDWLLHSMTFQAWKMKCLNKIPWLSRLFMTCTNPATWNVVQYLVNKTNMDSFQNESLSSIMKIAPYTVTHLFWSISPNSHCTSLWNKMNCITKPQQRISSVGIKESLTAEREVAGSIPGTRPTLRVLTWLRNEGTTFALQIASRGSDDHVKWPSRLQQETLELVSPISTFVPNTWHDTQIECFIY